ncbi:MAG: hypothetical protein HYY48_07170 [Gammaproteobacteria bacterium]|nr:hypothetical protein [Gammaproteobacteria bacterium]
MTAPDTRPPQRPSLHEGIEELESLLGDRPAPDSAPIPILDELAGPADAQPVESSAVSSTGIDPRLLAELARRLEQRVELELADLAGVIRGVVKRCILEELRAWLPAARSTTQDRAPEATHGGPDRPAPTNGPPAPR